MSDTYVTMTSSNFIKRNKQKERMLLYKYSWLDNFRFTCCVYSAYTTKRALWGTPEGSRLPGRSHVRRTTKTMAHDNPALDLQNPDLDEVNQYYLNTDINQHC